MRYYDVEVDLLGSASGSFGNLGADVDNNPGNNLNEIFSGENDKAKTDGYIGRFSLAWTPTDNQLYYVTWSEGFRPGFLNRPGGDSNADGSFTVPFTIDTDEVTNYEAGWKTDMLDGRLRFNGSVFYIEIDNMQTGIFDTSISNLFFISNAANAEVKGVEGDVTWAPQMVEGLTLNAAFSFLDSEVTDVLIPTNDINEGDELAFAPKFQGNIMARYEWDLEGGMRAHVMSNLSYSEKAYTDIITINRLELDSWLIMGATAGVSTDEWTAELYADNLTDETAELSGSFNYDRERITVARPLTVGVRFSLNF